MAVLYRELWLSCTGVLYREQSFGQLRTARVGMLVGRGCLGAVSFGLFLAALPLMALADIFAIVMSAPLLIAALSVPLLKETVGMRRWVAVLIGFAAVLFMVRPGGGMSLPGALLVVGSVVFYALTMISTRILGRTATAGTITFYSALVFLAIGIVTAPFVWIDPTLFAMLLMVATGLLAGCAQYTMTEAFRIAPPAVVAPFEYTSMVWALIVGFLVWRDIPTNGVLVSAGVIVLSGIYLLHREKLAQQHTTR